jgi:hypothetical protein
MIGHQVYLNAVSYLSKKVFTLQKKSVRIMVDIKPQHSCRGLFMRLQILPLPSEYIFSLLYFIINNLEHFQINSAVHGVNTRNKHHLHRPLANLTCFQKSKYYSGIKIFNNLTSSLKSQKLIPQYNCLSSGSDYDEKQLKYVHIFWYITTFFPRCLFC